MDIHNTKIRLERHSAPVFKLIVIAMVMVTVTYLALRGGMQVIAKMEAAETARTASLPFVK